MKGRPLPFPLTVYFVLDISKAKYIVIAFCNALLINQASFSTLQQKSLILKTKYCQLPSWQIYCSTHYTAVGYRSCIKYSLSLNILYFLFIVFAHCLILLQGKEMLQLYVYDGWRTAIYQLRKAQKVNINWWSRIQFSKISELFEFYGWSIGMLFKPDCRHMTIYCIKSFFK